MLEEIENSTTLTLDRVELPGVKSNFEFEVTLRPSRFEGYIGQTRTKEQIGMMI